MFRIMNLSEVLRKWITMFERPIGIDTFTLMIHSLMCRYHKQLVSYSICDNIRNIEQEEYCHALRNASNALRRHKGESSEEYRNLNLLIQRAIRSCESSIPSDYDAETDTEEGGDVVEEGEEGTFTYNETTFKVVDMPPDGKCGYHCMAHICPDISWQHFMNVDEWATDEDFQKFCNISGFMIEIYEDHGDTVLRTLLVPTGKCESTLSIEGRVLYRNSHYDVLEVF